MFLFTVVWHIDNIDSYGFEILLFLGYTSVIPYNLTILKLFSSLLAYMVVRMSSLVSKCPFLNQVTAHFLKNAGRSIASYAQRCPIMTEYMGCYATVLNFQSRR